MAVSTPVRTVRPPARRGAFSLACALLCVALSADGTAQQSTPPTPLDRAAALRDALESKPKPERTRADYDQAIEAFRAASHGEGEDAAQAAEATSAAAGLLAEEGRLFRQETTMLNAVGQYELLRQRFPESPFCTGALLHEGEIYGRDLHDRNAAATAFAEFLRLYPGSQFAPQARAHLSQLQRDSGAQGPADRSPATHTLPSSMASAHRSMQPPRPGAGSAAGENAPAPRHVTVDDGPDTAAEAPAVTSASSTAARLPVSASASPPSGLSLVTGVRHWSTPVYTRVAIDMQNQVQYEAVRVPNPDRIYFDLHSAKVAVSLTGRSVDVTDDGFLKRIRVAQYSPSVTRIVLDVSQVSEYSAFFLPNPWRLIIDVHGSKPGTATPLEQASVAPSTSVAPSSSGIVDAMHMGASPQTGQQAGASALGTGRRTTNGRSGPASSMGDIAKLSNEPSRVQATHGPTTGPIAASVAGTTPATQPARVIALAPGATTTSVATRNGKSVTPPPATVASVMRRTVVDDDEVSQTGNLPSSSSLAVAGQNKSGRNSRKAATAATLASPMHEAEPVSDGQRTLVRALGLKIGRIVIDAGHGGHDSGTIGPEGIEEKDVVLDVALRLGKLLKQRLGADVIYTRDNDTFIPLETRTAIANKAQADLFLSVHANSSPDPEARGVETYYLNFTTSPDALDVAARENAVSNESVYELSGLVKKIALKDKIDESREFAADVQNSLYTGLETGNAGLKDRGVKKAPFVVLIGANMPSILAEISFLTNPSDAFQLRNPAYRERIAESIYSGVARYIHGLSGVRLAQASGRASAASE